MRTDERWTDLFTKYQSADPPARERIWAGLTLEQASHLENYFGLVPPGVAVRLSHGSVPPPNIDARRRIGIVAFWCLLALTALMLLIAGLAVLS
jgi:hypothetical protein